MSEPEKNPAAVALGSITSPLKLAAQRKNAATARAALPPAACNCQQVPHKSSCPVWRKEYRARRKGAKETE